jgi:hypothetical protein
MGGKVGKARKACITDKVSDISGSALGGSVKITKSYDTKCVQAMLSK